MKKEKSIITVIISIFLLLLLIIIPPLFRTLFPRNVKSSSNINKEISVLRCSSEDENASVLATVKYIDGNIQTNTIKFTINNEEAFKASSSKLKNEFDLFTSLTKINKSAADKVTTFILDKNVIENEKRVESYFIQSISGEKSFYENMDYKCNIIKG